MSVWIIFIVVELVTTGFYGEENLQSLFSVTQGD